MVHMVTDKNDFDQQLAIAGGKVVVVDFTATWCGPCKTISPLFEELAAKNPNMVFLKVDVDEADDVGAHFDIQCMPTFIFLKNGKEITRFSGANMEKLRSLIETNSKN